MTKSPKNDDDKAAFAKAMQGVKPLRHQTNKATFQPPRPKKPIRRPIEDDIQAELPFSDHENLDPLASDELVSFSRPGLQHKILRKLRLGQYNVEAILDLHRKTVEEARESLSHFLLKCKKMGINHVLIVHGKGHSTGKPILKNKLNHWLRQTDMVLAFCSAAPKHGRGGALYVLLRR